MQQGRFMAKILIIDDDDSMRSVLRMGLETAGHLVFEAANGTEGLRQIEAGGVEVVVTDLLMPEMDGIEVIFNVRKKYPSLKVIAISGGGQLPPEGYLKIAQRGGARRILMKPFKLEELLQAVRDEVNGEASE
jgi:DNA-binding NtrC family response regulator